MLTPVFVRRMACDASHVVGKVDVPSRGPRTAEGIYGADTELLQKPPLFSTRRAVVFFFLAIGRRLRYLLDQQIDRLEKDFLEKGGIKGLMYKARVDYSRRQ